MPNSLKNEQVGTPPWGKWEVLLSTPAYKVKRITVNPGHRLSYQRHKQRDEHWFVVEGEGVVTLDQTERKVRSGDSVNIEAGTAHRITGHGERPLVFVEIQTGTYFGEDDIERLADDYGRQE